MTLTRVELPSITLQVFLWQEFRPVKTRNSVRLYMNNIQLSPKFRTSQRRMCAERRIKELPAKSLFRYATSLTSLVGNLARPIKTRRPSCKRNSQFSQKICSRLYFLSFKSLTRLRLARVPLSGYGRHTACWRCSMRPCTSPCSSWSMSPRRATKTSLVLARSVRSSAHWVSERRKRKKRLAKESMSSLLARVSWKWLEKA